MPKKGWGTVDFQVKEIDEFREIAALLDSREGGKLSPRQMLLKAVKLFKRQEFPELVENKQE